jgi:hypothetical protein
MSNLMQVNRQWSSRPADERFLSLDLMLDHFLTVRKQSHQQVISSKRLEAVADDDRLGLQLIGPDGVAYSPTHYAFGQVANRAEAPAGYLRTLPSPIAALNLNYGLQFKRDIDDIGILTQSNGANILRAATGPNYGRIWNAEILAMMVNQFGDGITGEWSVPGEFRKKVEVTADNTTLYAGDHDMFVFLVNEENRIELPNRRDGKPGSMARGFFIWNSEVGDKSFGFATFLYDYTCSNRIVWGADQYQEVRIRHTSSAPDKWLAEVRPALETYGRADTLGLVNLIESARAKKMDDLDKFLDKHFGPRGGSKLKAIHLLEENRPIETLWDVTTAATAQARSIPYQDERVKLERKAGELLRLAA